PAARRCRWLAAPTHLALRRNPRARPPGRAAARSVAASHTPFGVLPRPQLTLLGFWDNRFHRQRTGGDLVAANQRQRQPEAGALSGVAPGLETTLVQARVPNADRQPQPCPTRLAHPRGVRAPKPAEDQLLLARPQPDAVVADGD